MSGTVLIVDDDRNFTASVQEALELRGHDVIVHEDADLDAMKFVQPSAILMSVELPRTSGFSVCSRVRKDRELRSTPILLLSERTTPETIKKHAERPERANLYARKPLSSDQVVRLLEELIASVPPPLGPSSGESAIEDSSVPPPPSRRPIRRERHHSEVRPASEVRRNPWPSDYFRQRMAGVADVDAETANRTRRGAPEDRIDQLRQLLKRYETREQELVSLFEDMNTRGLELARLLAGVESDLQSTKTQIASFDKEKQKLQKQLSETEESFRTFHNEVTQVFTEKDGEERELFQRLEKAETRANKLDAVLITSRKQAQEDAERAQVLEADLKNAREEIEVAHNELVQLRDKVMRHEADRNRVGERLTAAEEVAQRQTEIAAEWERRLEEHIVHSDEQRNKTEQSFQNQIEILRAQSEALRGEHAAAVEVADQQRTEATRYRRELEDRWRVESEKQASALSQLQDKLHISQERAADAEQALANLKQEASGQVQQLKAEIAALTHNFDQARHQASDAEHLRTALKDIRAELDVERKRHQELLNRTAEVERSEKAALRRNGEAETQLRELQESTLDARRRLELESKERQNLEAKIVSLHEDLRKAEEEAEEHGESVLQLHSRLDELRADNQAYQIQLEDMGHVSVKLRESETQIAKAEAARQKAERARSETIAELELMRRDETELAQRLASRAGELEAARHEVNRLIRIVEQQNRQLARAEKMVGISVRDPSQIQHTLSALSTSEALLREGASRTHSPSLDGPKTDSPFDDHTPGLRGGGALLTTSGLRPHEELVLESEDHMVTDVVNLNNLGE